MPFLLRSLLLTVLLLAAAPAARAQTTTAPSVSEIADALRSDFIYVDPAADPTLSEGEVAQLREEIRTADVGAVYVVVLPEAALAQAGGDEGQLARAVVNEVRRDGVYAFVTGRNFVAGAAGTTPFEEGEVVDVRNAAVAANQGATPYQLLSDFVARLPAEAADSGGDAVWGLLALGAVGLGGFALYRSRKRRKRELEQVAEVRREAEQDLSALAGELYDLEPHFALPTAAEARADYEKATNAYVRARDALAAARRPDDLAAVSQTLEEGRYAMASARARLEGKPLPEHRAPCFFNPTHGPSVTDVQWAPRGGVPREVPACQADAARVMAGEEPETRQVTVAGTRRPYYDAPSYYGPWAGGYYGGFGGSGLFNGFLLGTLLSGGWGGGYGSGYGDAGGFDGGDFGGGGGFDAGDFGGGDFGDFGGGDF